MKPTTKCLRAAVQHLDDTWVRVYRDGRAWAGSKRRSRSAMIEVKTALEAAGFRCACTGTPGTVGEFIIDVALKLDGNKGPCHEPVPHAVRG